MNKGYNFNMSLSLKIFYVESDGFEGNRDFRVEGVPLKDFNKIKQRFWAIKNVAHNFFQKNLRFPKHQLLFQRFST